MGKPTRTYDERLAEERKKLEQARNRIRDLERKQKVAERKERTKRLIAIGAEVEHYAGCPISDLDSFKDYLKKYAYAIAKTQNDFSLIKDTDPVYSDYSGDDNYATDDSDYSDEDYSEDVYDPENDTETYFDNGNIQN